MTIWLKKEDVERIEGFDKETGETVIRYQLKLMTDGISVPVGLRGEALKEHEKAVLDEALIAFERWIETFITARLMDAHDYKIETDEFPDIRIFISEWKPDGDLLLITTPEDIIDIMGKGIYKAVVDKLSTKPVNRENIKVSYGFSEEDDSLKES